MLMKPRYEKRCPNNNFILFPLFLKIIYVDKKFLSWLYSYLSTFHLLSNYINSIIHYIDL